MIWKSLINSFNWIIDKFINKLNNYPFDETHEKLFLILPVIPKSDKVENDYVGFHNKRFIFNSIEERSTLFDKW